MIESIYGNRGLSCIRCLTCARICSNAFANDSEISHNALLMTLVEMQIFIAKHTNCEVKS